MHDDHPCAHSPSQVSSTKVPRRTQSRNTANMEAERGLSSFLLLLVAVLAEHGGCGSGTSAKLVGPSVRLVAG